MKTKTYEMYTDDGGLESLKEGQSAIMYFTKAKHKVTVTVEVEEPKIEITPSEFVKKMAKHEKQYGFDAFDFVKDLFGEGWNS